MTSRRRFGLHVQGATGFGRVWIAPSRRWLPAFVLTVVTVVGAVAPAPAQEPRGEKVLPVIRGERTQATPLLRGQRSALDGAAAARLEVLRERARQREESAAMVRDRLGPHGMSQKGLARRDARLRRLLRSGGVAEPETLSVLLIRIAFETDRSGDLTSVTTDGNFQLEPAPEDTVIFDPPPHDKNYFEAHMRGLSEYWSSMSNGLITVRSRVLPDGREDAVFLSDIADYGPGAGGFWTVELLEKLVRDMILESDGQLSGQVNLADFDFDDPNTYIIFAHAGADLQSNLVFTEGQEGYSPNDIPTFFVSLGDSARVQLPSTDSDSGTQGLVTECSVIPETTNQDGLSGSIAAALMHEFGHALGLPDLYSTRTGLPTIGYWGIMDSGTNLAAAIGIDETGNGGADRVELVTGLLPPAASAWTRWYLGFTEEIRVGSKPVTVDLPASYRQDTREKVLRLDVSPDEFFLVENRWIPPVTEGNWALYSDPGTGVVLYLGDFAGDPRVPPNTQLYDFFLPFAGGLQVWRVRQDRVEAFQANNTVQADRERLGIELIEADGIQDVGVFDFNTRGFIGSDSDSFRDLSTFVYTVSDGEGGTTTETITYPATSTSMMPDGRPSSESTFRIPTGAMLSGIGPSDRDAMRVTAQIEGLVDPGTGDGWPVELPDAPNGSGVPTLVRGDARTTVALDLAGVPSIVVAATVTDATAAPRLYAYAASGSPRYDQAVVATMTADPAGPLLVTDESPPSLVALGRDGGLQVFSTTGATGLDADGSFAFADSVDAGPVLLAGASGPWIAAADRASGRVGVLALDGTAPAPETGPGAIGPGVPLRSGLVVTRRDDTEHLAAVSADGLWTWSAGGGATVHATDLSFATSGRLVAWPGPSGDDERLIFAADDGRVVAFVPTGTGDWTARTFGTALDGPTVGELALGDVDGDGVRDLVAMTEYVVHARHASGANLRGFPKRLEDHYVVTDPFLDEVVGGPLVADVDDDALNEVVFTTSYGLVHAMDSDGGSTVGFPRRVAGAEVEAPLLTDLTVGSTSRRALVLFDALGDTLESGRRTFSARLTAVDVGPSPQTAERPAEWLARGGSVQRRGRAADAQGAAVAQADAKTVVYPNPVNRDSGPTTTVRFFSGAPHEARITVYNLEGQEVTSVRRRIDVEGVPADLSFSTEGMQSGAYLCRLQYVGAAGATTEVMTLYVER